MMKKNYIDTGEKLSQKLHSLLMLKSEKSLILYLLA